MRKRRFKSSTFRHFNPSYKTAFNWRAYANRADGLRLLWRNKIHVDTLIKTKDGFSDTVHWQVISALCPKLIEASKVVEKTRQKSFEFNGIKASKFIVIEFPEQVTSLLSRQLLDCAYGEKLVSLNKNNLAPFYSLSNHYNIKHGINICFSVVISLLNVQNCVQFLLFGLKHKHQTLKRESYSILCKNFKIILHVNQDFHLIPINYLKRLLLDDFLKLDEDEELAWIAILRWMRSSLLSTSEIVGIFNKMVSNSTQQARRRIVAEEHHQNQNAFNSIFERNANANFSLTLPAIQNPSSFRNSNRILPPNSQRDNINFNFFSPPIPSEVYSDKKEARTSQGSDDDSCFGLRLDSDSLSSLICDNIKSEDQLVELVKCLRFFRFRNMNAFNVMLEHNIIKQSKRLTLLINQMKIRYIMRKKLPIDETDKHGHVLRESLERLKQIETGKSKRIFNTVIRFVKCKQVTNFNSVIPQRLPLELNKVESPRIKPENSPQVRRKSEILTCEALTLPFIDSETLKKADNPRVPNFVALAIGGWKDGAVSDSMLTYDFVCNKWFKLNIRLPEPRAFHASCSRGLNNKSGEVIIFGGTNGKQILNSVISIDTSRDVSSVELKSCLMKQTSAIKPTHWSLRRRNFNQRLEYRFRNLSPMNEHRCHLSGVLHSDGKVYALGGHNGQQRLRSGEWYDWVSNQWHPIAEMTIARSDASACSHDNRIFIAGGQISDQFIQSSVEFYKANDNTWTFVTPMIVPRMAFRLVSYKNHLLAIGGTNGLFGGDVVSSVTRSVERYNFSQSTWSLCTPMNLRRSSFAVMQIENNLIVAGGCNGQERMKTCESLQFGRQIVSNRNNSELDIASAGRARLIHQQPTIKNHQSSWGAQIARNSLQVLNSSNHHPNDQLIISRPPRFRGISPTRKAMKWVQKASLPSKRSGFSISVVQPLKNTKDFTYHGSKTNKRPTVIKRKSRFDKLKIIKRRKFVKYLKIGVVVVIVVSMM